eukprot:8776201-Alexandrium_andersonii.AAC.1
MSARPQSTKDAPRAVPRGAGHPERCFSAPFAPSLTGVMAPSVLQSTWEGFAARARLSQFVAQ